MSSVNDLICGRHLYGVNGLQNQHAIGIGNGYVIAAKRVSLDQQPWLAKVQVEPLEEFIKRWTDVYVCEYPSLPFSRSVITERAISLLHQVENMSYNETGDNFAFMIMTNQLFLVDDEVFGKHLISPRGIPKLGGIAHHGIGIEGNRVIEFNKSTMWGGVASGLKEMKLLPSNSASDINVHISTLKDFANGYQNLRVIEHSVFDPLQTRNRAMNVLGRRGYNLLTNNCEHIANWCATGRFESEQSAHTKWFALAAVAGFLVKPRASYFTAKSLEYWGKILSKGEKLKVNQKEVFSPSIFGFPPYSNKDVPKDVKRIKIK